MYNVSVKRRWYNSINNFKKYQENSCAHHFFQKLGKILSGFLNHSITGKLLADHSETIKNSVVYSLYAGLIAGVVKLLDLMGNGLIRGYETSLLKKFLRLFHSDKAKKGLLVLSSICMLGIYLGVSSKFYLFELVPYLLACFILSTVIVYFMPTSLNEAIEESWLFRFINYVLSPDGETFTKKWNLYLLIFGIAFLPKSITLILIAGISLLNIAINVGIRKKEWKTMIVDFGVILLLAVMVFATLISTDRSGSIRDLFIHLSAVLMIFNMITSIDNKSEFNSIVAAFVYTASLVALYGLYQYKVGVQLDAAWVDEANNPDLTTRVYSVFGNPNILAEYLIMAIPLAMGMVVTNKGIFKKIITLGCTAVLVLALILTFSRGGWLGFMIGFGLMVLMFKVELIWAMIPAGVLSLFIMPESILNRLLSIGNLADSSNAYRIKIWRITTQMISDHWMLGVGLGYLPYKRQYINYIRTMKVCHAHNMLLEAFAEMGFAGFIALIVLIVLFIKGILRLKKQTTDKYIFYMSIAVAGSFFAILGHGLTENVLYLPRIIWTFWMIIGFGIVLMKIGEKKQMS